MLGMNTIFKRGQGGGRPSQLPSGLAILIQNSIHMGTFPLVLVLWLLAKIGKPKCEVICYQETCLGCLLCKLLHIPSFALSPIEPFILYKLCLCTRFNLSYTVVFVLFKEGCQALHFSLFSSLSPYPPISIISVKANKVLYIK